jgi:hypothetical protein
VRWLAISLLLASCGPPCVDVGTSCEPLYEPFYDNIYELTLRPTCGAGGVSCHAAAGANGDVVFADPDKAYDLLLDRLVIPGEPACSQIIRRIDAEDAADVMPPGDRLDKAERCAIRQWIEAGAKR